MTDVCSCTSRKKECSKSLKPSFFTTLRVSALTSIALIASLLTGIGQSAHADNSYSSSIPHNPPHQPFRTAREAAIYQSKVNEETEYYQRSVGLLKDLVKKWPPSQQAQEMDIVNAWVEAANKDCANQADSLQLITCKYQQVFGHYSGMTKDYEAMKFGKQSN